MASNFALGPHSWQRSREHAKNDAGTGTVRSRRLLLKLAMLVVAIVVCFGSELPMAAQGCTPPPPNCPCYQQPKSPLSGSNYSNVDKSIITQREGGDLPKAYTLPPSKWPNAGVTVGIGVDLGAQSSQGLLAMGVPQALVDKLQPFLGLHGTDAVNALNAANAASGSPFTLTAEEDAQLNNAVLNKYFNSAGSAYDGASAKFDLSQLPWQAQTVLADLWYNMGDLRVAAPNFWQQMTSGDWQGAYNNLMDFTKKDDRLRERAQADGALLKQAMDACTLPGG